MEGGGEWCVLGPGFDELVVGWSSLTDYGTIPAGVVVDVDDAACTCGEASLDEHIIRAHEIGIEVTVGAEVDEVLPADGKSKDVEVVVFHEMVHLLDIVGRWAGRRSLGTTLCCGVLISLTIFLIQMSLEGSSGAMLLFQRL